MHRVIPNKTGVIHFHLLPINKIELFYPYNVLMLTTSVRNYWQGNIWWIRRNNRRWLYFFQGEEPKANSLPTAVFIAVDKFTEA